ncbi:gephyrin-like molybdotransferase Glp [Brevibacillus ginsengisoli]|uniref:molybdopterin molybdotransferase MoeA n=1 Tax=Brevibacillus ginsengisoli TaxID=363854 RepID=UPI003CFB1CE5
MEFFNVKSADEVLSLIKQVVVPIDQVEQKHLSHALHDVLAEDIVAREHIPNFCRSTVDGYAVWAHDTFGATETLPVFLQIVGEVKMGEAVTQQLKPGEAIYVPTGGMIPEGANSMVMIEYCENISGLLNVYKQVAPHENVIFRGEDVAEHSVVLTAGTRLYAPEIGVLAALGVEYVPVRRKPVVGYLSTGDEIMPIATKQLAVGEVRDMNGFTIGALTQQWGFSFIYGGTVQDDPDTLKTRLAELLQQVDMLVISGGSSVGMQDFSVSAIQSLGEPGVFVHGISVKPGKPTIISMAGNKPVLGLPGHPASALTIYRIFGSAILSKLAGYNEADMERKPHLTAHLTKNVPSSTGRTDYVRVKLNPDADGVWYAEPVLGKSGLISTFLHSDGMITVAAGKEGLKQGEIVSVQLFHSLD